MPFSYLARDGDLSIVVIADGTLLLVRVVEGDGDGGLGDARLAILVHQLLKVCGSHLKHRTQDFYFYGEGSNTKHILGK